MCRPPHTAWYGGHVWTHPVSPPRQPYHSTLATILQSLSVVCGKVPQQQNSLATSPLVWPSPVHHPGRPGAAPPNQPSSAWRTQAEHTHVTIVSRGSNRSEPPRTCTVCACPSSQHTTTGLCTCQYILPPPPPPPPPPPGHKRGIYTFQCPSLFLILLILIFVN